MRYQRELVRRYVHEEGGKLIDEVAFMDLQPDRGTGAVVHALEAVRQRCTSGGATLLSVDFAEELGWRPHQPLKQFIRDNSFDFLPLRPDPIMLDGQCFDPVEHFQSWRLLEGQHQERRRSALSALIAMSSTCAEGRGRAEKIAHELNAAGHSTTTGRPWTAENVRKQLVRHSLADANTLV